MIWLNEHPEAIAMLVQLFGVQVFFINFLKIAQAGPRPFWVNDKIVPKSCYLQFGLPSGHAMCAFYFANFLYFRYFWFKIEDKVKNALWMAFGTIVIQVGWVLMCYSRFYLGIHSLNQLIYGALLGAWSLYMCLTWLNPLVVSTVQYVKENGWNA